MVQVPRCSEVLYVFPPIDILNRLVAKARADGVRAILVTPLAVSAPYWSKLLRASVVPNADVYIRIRRQAAAPPDSDAAGELTLFAVDFSPWCTRRPVDMSSPPCGMESISAAGILVALPSTRRTASGSGSRWCTWASTCADRRSFPFPPPPLRPPRPRPP